MPDVGLNMITYLADSIDSPVYDNPVPIVKDETLNLTTALADVTDRRCNGWRIQETTLIEGDITVTVTFEPADTDFGEFRTAYFDRTQIVLFFCNGDATTSGTWYGLLGAFKVSGFNVQRNLEDGVMVEMTFTPVLETSTDNTPTWHSVTVA